ncbi:hypothetical protein [Aggregatilinea lenta]|uniref:hypothetical protein n=1 Tax=Aggregatilinea lenta TaxID=913108 RepID=UPI000E5BE930|nr:hypothetical protein [Aggregatilinea lenta]
MKTNSERTIEALTWAAVVIWMGFALIMHLLGYLWLVVMVLSIILLTSAIYQRSRGWHTSLTIWVAGVWMAVFSVIEVVNEILKVMNDGDGLQIDVWVYAGIVLISMGLAVVLRNLQAPTPAARRPEQERPPIVPTQIQDDTSSGYLPPSGSQRVYTDARTSGMTTGLTNDIRATQQPPRATVAPEPSSRSRRRARPANSNAAPPNDLEARVEDIIRRSRERRDQDNLPY